MKILLSAAAVVALIAVASAPALAGSCPKIMKKVDAGLATSPQLTSEQMPDTSGQND
jgi:hypothetical protein